MGKKIKFEVHYYNHPPNYSDRIFTHSYLEKWARIDLFCPFCGKQYLWFEANSEDIELGSKYICVNCCQYFYMPSYGGDFDEQDDERLEKLVIAEANN